MGVQRREEAEVDHDSCQSSVSATVQVRFESHTDCQHRFVVGPPALLPPTADALGETTINIWRGLSGQIIPTMSGGIGQVVDVRDVARIFLFVVDNPEKTTGERFLAVSAFATPQVYYDILNKHYPDRKGIIQVGEPGEGYMPDYSAPLDGHQTDNSKVPKFTGQDWIPFEQTVLDAAKAFESYL